MADVYISFGFNGLKQPQASIESDGLGYRIAGGKYDGMGREVLRRKLTKRDADEIRRYLDIVSTATSWRMVSAAPDLLEALEILVHAVKDTEMSYDSFVKSGLEHAQDAIAKATGEQ